MYLPDLAPYTPFPGKPGVAVGWLAGNNPYSQGMVSDDIAERLWAFCAAPLFATFGIHACDLCAPPQLITDAQRGDQKLVLGIAEIWIFDASGIPYIAPTLIYHYVVDHQYAPPPAFLEALVHCPLPQTPAYEALAAAFAE